MTFPSLRLLLAAAFLATASLSLDAQAKPKSAPAHPAKAPAKAALVDINRATKEELKSLPGIQDPQADRIIAGRPYLSKARLVSRKILNIEQYNAIKKRIIARQ